MCSARQSNFKQVYSPPEITWRETLQGRRTTSVKKRTVIRALQLQNSNLGVREVNRTIAELLPIDFGIFTSMTLTFDQNVSGGIATDEEHFGLL